MHVALFVSGYAVRPEITSTYVHFVAHEIHREGDRGKEGRGTRSPRVVDGGAELGFGAICRYLGCAWLRCYLSNYTATCDDTRPDCLKRGGSWTFAFVAVLPGDSEERDAWFCRAIARTVANATPEVNRISLYVCTRWRQDMSISSRYRRYLSDIMTI